MTKRMLVDATHPEETRVAIVESYRDTNRLEDFDFGLASKPILRGNIYLAKVMRVEPSLQAAFVEYGGNRHGFLPFSEIHPDYFRIPMADRPADEEDLEEAQEKEKNLPEEIPSEEAAAPETPAQDLETAPQPEPPVHQADQAATPETPPEAPAKSSLGAFGETIDDNDDPTVGLITDFGNAAVGGSLTEVPMPEAPPEDVGGDVQERIIRPRRRYKIQEVVKRGQVMLIQVVKEERGNKGAALTSFLSLAGRYCVLMPNTDHGGGVSRKITNHQDRRRLKEILDQLQIPEGMAVILRTAGMEQEPAEIQRDLGYLLSLWDNIREQTLQSTAPNLIYEEANLIKRSVRDIFTKDISEILIAGQEGFTRARDFMQAIMPDQAKKVKLYEEDVPLFIRYQVENQIDALHNPVAQLRSGGYLVINPTEALVSIDVNSGRATRERHIEETALKTNLEASDEIARQLRLRDLAGLVVIDFIDMEDGRNNAAVERRMKDVMKNDRSRLQIGRITPFGLMELSRQRLRPSLTEINFEKCPHCYGTGVVRSPDSAALSALRAIEEEAIRQRSSEITMYLPSAVAVFLLNNKRDVLSRFEEQYGLSVVIMNDDNLPSPGYKLEHSKGRPKNKRNIETGPAVDAEQIFAETENDAPPSSAATNEENAGTEETANDRPARRGNRRFRQNEGKPRRARSRRGNEKNDNSKTQVPEQPQLDADGNVIEKPKKTDSDNQRRRRGRRGGRRRNNNNDRRERNDTTPEASGNQAEHVAAQPAAAREPMSAPMTVRDIDTTPKPPSQDKKNYEVINPPSDAPKAGWWRRITGQE
ncbi:MAG TPA: ribonuclease E/G [Rhodospirillaceae bacterium]|nr:ribonuclease E/G [Rhodospirillaceae bacterium]